MSRIEKIWYEGHWVSIPLLPLSWLFRLLVLIRRCLYQWGWLKTNQWSVPLIVVGNISVGGTGKTPFVIWLVDYLRTAGYQPGVVLRGYGGNATVWPQQVTIDSDPVEVGDEAVLLARRCHCPVVAAPDRGAAVAALLKNSDCNIILSDDGLQHYAMGRDIEIVIVDGERRFGNGQMLPAGPLREPISRLLDVDLVIVNGEPISDGEYRMTLTQCYLYNLLDPSIRKEISQLKGETVHAIAGVGNPERFFKLLKKSGVDVIAHPFADHHTYTTDDLLFSDEQPVIMTEKDAVKCAHLAHSNYWVLAIEMSPEVGVETKLQTLLKEFEVIHNNRTQS